jgi:hypothetical protein
VRPNKIGACAQAPRLTHRRHLAPPRRTDSGPQDAAHASDTKDAFRPAPYHLDRRYGVNSRTPFTPCVRFLSALAFEPLKCLIVHGARDVARRLVTPSASANAVDHPELNQICRRKAQETGNLRSPAHITVKNGRGSFGRNDREIAVRGRPKCARPS